MLLTTLAAVHAAQAMVATEPRSVLNEMQAAGAAVDATGFARRAPRVWKQPSGRRHPKVLNENNGSPSTAANGSRSSWRARGPVLMTTKRRRRRRTRSDPYIGTSTSSGRSRRLRPRRGRGATGGGGTSSGPWSTHRLPLKSTRRWISSTPGRRAATLARGARREYATSRVLWSLVHWSQRRRCPPRRPRRSAGRRPSDSCLSSRPSRPWRARAPDAVLVPGAHLCAADGRNGLEPR